MGQKQPVPARSEDLIRFVEELKRQWMATIDALIDPLMIIDENFNIIKANKSMAHASETDVKGLLGKKCYESFAKRKSPCEGCQLKDAASERKAMHFSLPEVKDGKYFEVTSQPIFNPSGDVEGLVHIYRDRTDAKRMQEQLLQSEKLASIGLLAGGVAHEINNPLGGILVFSQMLLREMDKSNQHYGDVQEIEAAAQRCKTIVENLLEFARTRPANSQSATQVLDVNEAVKSALRFAKVNHKWKHVDVQEHYHPGGLNLSADRNKLIQIFLNLIQNAFQSMPDGGQVTLRSGIRNEGRKKMAYFEVEDTGVGIPEESLGKIFDPFFTTKDPGEGTGLGLAICYGIINEMGGRLDVKSTVNVGTCFTVLLPMDPSLKQIKAS